MTFMKPPLLLLIDDEQGVRESLKMVFSKSFRLLEADSADAALPQVRDALPDVVLLDVMMPKTDGIKELHPRCEVIMLTAITSLQLAEKAISLGAFDLIGKPFDVVNLRQKVICAVEKVARNSIEPAPSSLLFNS
jgi:two-component system, sensor histidine kinase and response regulator